MKTSGAGIFFDGVTSARRDAAVELGPDAVQIRTPAGELMAEWRYDELASFSAPEGVLRVGLAKNPVLARLEIRDAELAAPLDQHIGTRARAGVTTRHTQIRVVAWSLAAAVSLVLVAVFGIPALALQIAPLVPVSIEQRLGASVDQQVRTFLDHGSKDRPFECGSTQADRAGRAAFDKLVGKLQAVAALPFPLRAAVIRVPSANAFALPGGRVYVFEGLIDQAGSPDELAGVIAHEIGHVAHRDGVRAIIQGAGLSFVFGMLLGDFGGGGAAVIAVRTVLQSSYSRETEAAADAYGARLVAMLGGDPRALGAILMRIAGTPGPLAKIILDHPEAKDRAAAIDAIAGPRPRATLGDGTDTAAGLLDATEWAALKRICARSTQEGLRGK
jgi:Zn-dependent protease with chaperone function